MGRGLPSRRASRVVGAALAIMVVLSGSLADRPADARPPGETATAIAAHPSVATGTDPLALHAVVITPRLLGSAFAIAPGLAVTAAHVVQGLAPGAPLTLRRGPPGGPTTTGRLIGLSPVMDLAVLEIPRGFLRDVSGETPAPRNGGPGHGPTAVAAGERLAASGSVPLRHPQLALPRRVDGASTGRAVDVPGLGPGFIAALPGTVLGFSGGPVIDGAGRFAGMIIAIRRLPAAGGNESALNRPALSDEVYVLSAPALIAEAHRIARHARTEAKAPR